MNNQDKDYCPVEPKKPGTVEVVKPVSESTSDEAGAGKWTAILFIIVIILIIASSALAYLILVPRDSVTETTLPVELTPTRANTVPTEALQSDKIEDIEKAVENSEVDTFDSELQDIQEDLEQL